MSILLKIIMRHQADKESSLRAFVGLCGHHKRRPDNYVESIYFHLRPEANA